MSRKDTGTVCDLMPQSAHAPLRPLRPRADATRPYTGYVTEYSVVKVQKNAARKTNERRMVMYLLTPSSKTVRSDKIE